MYRATYPFKSTDENALTFEQNDMFTVIDKSRDSHWWLVQNGKGQVGYVPANYLNFDDVSHTEVVKSIDRAIAAIQKQAPLGNLHNLPPEQAANLQKLRKHRDRVIEDYRLERAHDVQLRAHRQAPNSPTSSTGSGNGSSSKRSSNPPPPPQRLSSVSSSSSSSSRSPRNSANLSANEKPALSETYMLIPGVHDNHQYQAAAANKIESSQTAEEQNGVSNASSATSEDKSQEKISESQSLDGTNSGNKSVIIRAMSDKNTRHTGTEYICKQCQNTQSNTASSGDGGSAGNMPITDSMVSANIGHTLVEEMRATSQLSYGKSQAAVDQLLRCLKNEVPQIANIMDSILSHLNADSGDTGKDEIDLNCQDAERLRDIFTELAKCKDDSQQRSWFLHEDEHIITGYLEELISLLNDARTDVSKAIVRQDHYEPLNNLVMYYQMVSHTEVVKSIDRAIAAIQKQAPLGNLHNLPPEQAANLQKLRKHRDRVIEDYRLERAHDVQLRAHRQAPNSPTSSTGSGNGSSSKRSSNPPPPPQRLSSVSSSSSSSSRSPRNSANLSANEKPALSETYMLIPGVHDNHQYQAAAANKIESSQTAEEQNGVSNASSATSEDKSQEKISESQSLDGTNSGNKSVIIRAMSDKNTRHTGTEYICKQCQNTQSNTASSGDGGSAGNMPITDSMVSANIGHTLVEEMRATSQLSYGKSQAAVDQLLRCLKNEVPQIANIMDSILSHLNADSGDTGKDEIDLNCQDAERLRDIFTELAKCKDDSQQRSWFLHEDEHIITGYLEELISLLNDARTDVSKAIVRQDHYEPLNNLVMYYQMEQRVTLRMLLLQVFGSVCALDARFISELLSSVLPLDLVREIQADISDIQKLNYSILVLTMIFSMGEKVPLHYDTQINDKFINFLFDLCENPPEGDSGEQILELVVNLILSFNLHFELPSENMVMRVLAKRKTSKFFTERLMLLVNRGDDPVRMFEHEPKPPSSLLKFFTDLYSSQDTANLLYTNDARVLIDIIVGQLSDLEPSNPLRTDYLALIELVLKNTDYHEHRHRCAELQKCFKRIANEEDEATRDIDKAIVKEIWREFPDIFYNGA